MLRRLVLGLVIYGGLCAGLFGCKLSANYDDTRYRCDESGQCPDGFSCIQGWCEAVPPDPDGGLPDPDSGLPPLPDGCGTMGIPYNDFEVDTINTRRWSYSDDGTLTVAHAGGQLVFTIPAGQAGAGARYYTAPYYRMQGGTASVEVPPLQVDSGVSFTFRLETHGNERWWINHRDGALTMKWRDVRGDEYQVASIPYEPDQHRFWRFREQDGTVYWETSADGVTYNENASSAIDVSQMLVRLRLSVWLDVAQPEDRVLVADNLNGGVASDLAFCPVEILRDDFDDGQIALVWDDWDTGTGAVFEQDGQLVSVFAGAGEGDSGYYSLTRYDMTQGALVVEAPGADPGEMSMFVNLDFPQNGDDATFVIQNGMLRGHKDVATGESPVFLVPFDPEQHRWLRLRGDGGTVYWETSPDGQTWQMQGVHSEPPYDLTEVAIEIGSESIAGSIHNIGNGFDNLNLGP